MTVALLDGLSAVAGGYDGFILDMWGVLHDGAHAFPRALEALAALRRDGRRVLLLTNAPRRAARLAGQIAALRIGPDLYDHLLSSGEAVHRALARRDEPVFATLGRRFALLGPPGDHDLVDGLDYRAAPPGRADFILNVGPLDPAHDLEHFRPLLAEGLGRGLPMVCANPDMEVVSRGRRVACAGLFARHYQDQGGQVVRRGKPEAAIYAEALGLLGTEPERTLAVGDGMATDILGAAGAGLDAVLVTGGVHAAELGTPPDPAAVAALAARVGVAPLGAMAEFGW